MERREALRSMGALIALPVLRTEAMDALLARAPLGRHVLPEPRVPTTLSPQQDALVIRLAEIILPETDTPGATAARVNEFVDLILSEWYEPHEAEGFIRGLEDTDARSRAKFGSPFLECPENEQQQVVAELDRDAAASVTTQPNQPSDVPHFFHQMKHLTLTGFFTSEVGMTEALDHRKIPGAYLGCEPLRVGQAEGDRDLPATDLVGRRSPHAE